jgi:Tfp pilus assembly protein PilN
MIRINLLQKEKKVRKADTAGQKSLLFGLVAVVAWAAAVFFLWHGPMQQSIDDMRADNDKRSRNIKKLTDETREFDTVQAQLNAAKDQEEAIRRLNSARAVPSWMLYELSKILTKDHKPTMSTAMAERIKNDPNRQLTSGWDPKRLWLTGIDEKDGAITLTGGAQSTADITQFALRLQASVFFSDITPIGTAQAIDQQSKLNYYTFTITGKGLY